MSTGKIGVGVIGLRMGNGHLAGYAKDPRCTIIGVCDVDKDLLATRQQEYKARVAVTDYRELLSIPEIGLISVASPDYYHAEQSIAAMEAGKDVLCEKPLTLTMAEAKEIAAAVKRTGRRFMIGQVCRYAPGFVLAKRLIERGEIGRLYLAESEYAHSYRGARGVGDWRVDPRREPLIGGGCHAVDLLRWIAGDVTEAFGYANHLCLTDWPVNDCSLGLFQFASGAIGKVMVSVGCVRPYTMRSVFYGTEGTIVCDNTSADIQLCSQKNLTGAPAFATLPVNIASHNVGAEIREFIDCIVANKPVVTNVDEGVKTVATCIAVAESARTGKPVRVQDLL
ncbi:MAG: Gfo/Idh/MocA family oxidoreductase [Lentisphaerae bacterium]|nr:Gfo/Idh/MocA family oxidoreductase [Lentisphaerota bacterium]